jgi:hypothetical protein
MNPRCYTSAVVTLLCCVPPSALACGACDEDKVAATYDHAVVQQAATQKRVIVYCDVSGSVTPEKLREAVASVAGVDATSIRISKEPAALSFALDPKVQSAQSAVAEMKRVLNPRGDIAVLKSVTSGEF